MRITVEQILPLRLNALTANGRVVPVDGPVEFSSSDESIATVVSTGPLTATLKPTGKPGTVQVRARFDADLGEGRRLVEAVNEVTIVEEEAVRGEIVFETPVRATPTPPQAEIPTPTPVPEPPVSTIQFILPEGETVPERAYGPQVVRVRSFGALGDGKTDDTEAFIKAVQALPPEGGTVWVEDGTYMLRASAQSWLRSRMRLLCSDKAILKTIPHDSPRAYTLFADGLQDIVFENLNLVGERLEHTYKKFEPKADGSPNVQDTHEWAHGLRITKCSRVSLINCRVMYCTGDGVSVGGEDIFIYALWSQYNRRQGLTVGGSTNVRVYNCDLLDTGDYQGNLGTNPKAGVDIEPDAPRDARNIRIWNCRLLRNRVGVEMFANSTPAANNDYAEVDGVVVENSEIAHNTIGLALTRTRNVKLRKLFIHDQNASGIHVIEGVDGLEIDGCHFRNNYLRNGIPKARSFELAGTDTRTTRDILLQGEPKNVTFPTPSKFD